MMTTNKKPKDFTIFRYSTMLALTRAGITTFAELEKMSNAEIANIRGLGKRGYDEVLEKLGRSDAVRTTIQGQ
jgi:DNA-directed RNA polymerase alpha subunit